MKKLALVAVGLVALVTASLAVARSMDYYKTVTAVSGTFAATTTSGKTDTRTCTTTDGKTITSTSASYTGTASSGTADLNGQVTVDTHSVINTTDSVGEVDGRLRITASAGKTDLHFSSVYDHGNVAGLATGRAATHGVQLVGNLSGAFTAGSPGGFSSGKIGGGTSGGSAIELGFGRCAPSKPVKENADVEGTVTAASATSVTVAGVTCAVPSSLSASVLALKPNVDRAHMRCSLVSSTLTLVKIDKTH
jgi:hypothetical protein